MVLAPEKAAEVCRAVIDKFDGTIAEYYRPEDIAKGWTEEADRYGVNRKFPIMTISIAIIICQKGTYDSAVSIAKAAAEMKAALKEKSGSNFSLNRRAMPR
jgi:hypothetical protein